MTAADVATISLADLRTAGPERVTQQLLALPKGAVCVVNAAGYRDVEVFVAGLLAAEAKGKRYLYRTAASFVRVRAGLAPRPLLTADEMTAAGAGENGGLLIVGSYVPKSTQQLNALLRTARVRHVELDVPSLLAANSRAQEIDRATRLVDQAIGQGEDVALATSRELITGADAEANLTIGQSVSDALVAVANGVMHQPRFLLAKGGITASDIATAALNVTRAQVLGQILPGVPVWRLGSESRYPGMPYIVFPGNVGDDDALNRSLARLYGQEQ